jgi:hypothetical protein
VRHNVLVLATLAGLIVPAGALASDSGGIGVRLIHEPAINGNPLATSYILDRLAPGTTIHRHIEVSNSTRSDARIAVYPAAASLSGGNFSFESGHSGNELSRWTTVDHSILHLPPGGTAAETVTIRVPRDASPGEHYAVVWAQVSAPSRGDGVTLVNRVGVRIYLSVGHGGEPSANFAIGPPNATRSSTGQPLVVAQIRNSGGRTLDIGGYLMLKDGPGGLRAGPFPASVGAALSPGTSETAIVRLDRHLPRGPWRAELHLRGGSIQRVAAATISFSRVPPPTAGAPSGHLRLKISLTLAALAMIAVAILLLRRARSRGLASPPDYA